jgi:transposase
MKLEFLPAYSPDFNPIEQAFSSIKSYMRRHYKFLSRSSTTGNDSSNEAVIYILLHEAIFSITPDHAKEFYYHSGYIEENYTGDLL